jgi:hypothetical protein
MPKSLHTIRSVRYDSRKDEVKLYTTCGRIVISASDAGILVKFRAHKNKVVVDLTRWQPAPTAKDDTDALIVGPRRNLQRVRTAQGIDFE